MLRKISTKPFLFLSLIIFGFTASAKTYYISSSGNDANSGTSESSAWQTLNKVNSIRFSPGDNILFRRGDTFYGSINVTRSGSSGNPITYGAYGSGSKPIITGFANVTSWKSLGGNIWESTNAVSTLAYTNMVSVKGVNTAMGRWPNDPKDALFQTRTGDNIITSDTLSSVGINWTGAEIALSNTTYMITRGKITAQSGNRVTYSKYSSGATMWQGSGKADRTAYYVQRYIIQNDPRTLDVPNEWYYNPSTKKLRIYSTSQPVNVRIATIDVLLTMNSGCNYITIDNIAFEGSNKSSVVFGTQNYVTIQSCDFDYCGENTIRGDQQGGDNNIGSRIINCTINHSNNMGITLGPGHKGLQINNNKVKNTGIDYGMTASSSSPVAITATGERTNIAYNVIDSTGYLGISFRGNNSIVNNNLVMNSCIGDGVKDGGAIYLWNGGGQTQVGLKILNNIVITTGKQSQGIYLDNSCNGVDVIGNSVDGCKFGITLNGWNINVLNNTFYDNSEAGILFRLTGTGTVKTFNNVVLKNNISFAKYPGQFAIYFIGDKLTTNGNLISDSNYYAKPIGNIGKLILGSIGTSYNYYDLPTWQKLNVMDIHSKTTPKAITDVNDLRFEYNASNQSKAVGLDANYIDVKGKSYNGSITLAPYTSAVLIRNGPRTSNQPPVANAGQDRTIELPKNSIVLDGSGSDADGTIASYLWTKISGPSTGTILDPTSPQSGFSNLVQGVYKLQLAVTDNNGAVGTSIVSVTVNSENGKENLIPNNPPTANAGDDRVIDLPKNSIVLQGSGSDNDGTISSYEWTKISGPSSGTILDPKSPQSGLSYLVQGVYQLQLAVTDNNGAVGKSTLTVTVNSGSNNISPIANAGEDRIIDLPKNSIVLQGNGSDEDGTISSYEWTKISGPSSGTILDPKSPQSGFSYLVRGVYQLQLAVTDNNGAVGKSTLTVTVNSGSNNISPIANAGEDRTVKLPKNSIVLQGSGSDADGTIASYLWTKISGPSAGTILDPASPNSGVGYLEPGVYQFQLSVRDNQGATANSEMQVTVLNANQSRQMAQSNGISLSDSLGLIQNNIMDSNLGIANTQYIDQNMESLRPVDLKVFPNPFHNILNITISGDAGKYKLILMDAFGRTLLSKQGVKGIGSIQLTETSLQLSNGIYFLKVIQNNNYSTIKLVRQ